MEVVFWEMTPDDYDELLRLWRQSDGVGLHEGHEDSRESITGYLKRNPGMSFVAVHRGRIIGAVLCGHDGRCGSLHHLAVHPAFRHHGIGKRLVEKALERLQDEGIRKAFILVYRDNVDAGAFWQAREWRARPDLMLMVKEAAPEIPGFRFKARPYEMISV